MWERHQSGLVLPLNADCSLISPETHTPPEPPVYFTQDRKERDRYMEEGDMQWFLVKQFGIYVVCPSNYEHVHPEPVQHTDNDGNIISDALYFIDEQPEKGFAVYLSYLPPNKKTSEAHRHWKDMPEYYRILAGGGEMTLGYVPGTKTIELDAHSNNHLRVPFGMGHQLKAGKNGLLALIRTENPHSRPRGSLHIRDNNVPIAA